VPSRFKEEIDGSLRNLVSDLGNLSGFVDRLAAEADSAKNQDNERQQIQATAGMQAVEIERLRNQVETLRLRLSGAEKNNEEVQKTYQDVLASKKEQSEMLQEKLKVCNLLFSSKTEEGLIWIQQCQEQLEGKRHVFYTAHDDVEGKARILSIAADNDYREKAKIIQSLIDSEPEDKLKIIDILFATNAKAPVHSRSGMSTAHVLTTLSCN
jgi:regulator of replication initiation timing